MNKSYLLVPFFAGWLAITTLIIAEKIPEKDVDANTVIGIDIGSSYSRIAVFRNGRVEIIPNDRGNLVTPSYLAFDPDGQLLIGDAAIEQSIIGGRNVIHLFDVKRMLGLRWYNHTLQNRLKYLSFEAKEVKTRARIQIATSKGIQFFAPIKIYSLFLTRMKATAEAYLGRKVSQAVVTVPANYYYAQHRLTKIAGKLAGLDMINTIHEPSAAALAYGLNNGEGEQNILVYHLTSTNLDVSLLFTNNGNIAVVSTENDIHVGGEFFNKRVIDYFVNSYKNESRDIIEDKRALHLLRLEVEKAIRALSYSKIANIEIVNFHKGANFSRTLTRTKFEELNRDLFWSTIKFIKKVLERGKTNKLNVDHVVLIGKSSTIPKVQQLVSEFFEKELCCVGVSPEEAVIHGAGILAGVLSDEMNGNLIGFGWGNAYRQWYNKMFASTNHLYDNNKSDNHKSNDNNIDNDDGNDDKTTTAVTKLTRFARFIAPESDYDTITKHPLDVFFAYAKSVLEDIEHVVLKGTAEIVGHAIGDVDIQYGLTQQG